MGNSAGGEALGITCWQASLAAALHIAAGQAGRQAVGAGKQAGVASSHRHTSRGHTQQLWIAIKRLETGQSARAAGQRHMSESSNSRMHWPT